MKFIGFAIATTLLLLPAAAHAVTLATEPFDYSNADPTLSTSDGVNSGGSGFTGSWSTIPTTLDVNLSNDDTSLVYPAGTGLTASGDRVRETNATGGSPSQGAVRTLSTTFDASAESTFYFSLLAKKRLQGGSFFAVSLLDGTGAQFFSTGAGSGSSGIRIGRTSTTAVGGGATEYFLFPGPIGLLDNETYMYIGKVIFHAGATADEYYLSIYQTGVDTVPATEPGSWMFTHTNDSAPATSLSGNTLAITGGSMSGASADTNVDEIRFGTTYLSVVGLRGDYNGDEVVDAADYVVWRKTNINGAQGYIDWQTNFGRSETGGAGSFDNTAVPEPATWASVLIAALAFVVSRRNER